MNHHWRKNGTWKCRHCETEYPNNPEGRTALLHDTHCSRLSVAQRAHRRLVRQEVLTILADRRAVTAAATPEAAEHAKAQLRHTVESAHPDSRQAAWEALRPPNPALAAAVILGAPCRS